MSSTRNTYIFSAIDLYPEHEQRITGHNHILFIRENIITEIVTSHWSSFQNVENHIFFFLTNRTVDNVIQKKYIYIYSNEARVHKFTWKSSFEIDIGPHCFVKLVHECIIDFRLNPVDRRRFYCQFFFFYLFSRKTFGKLKKNDSNLIVSAYFKMHMKVLECFYLPIKCFQGKII